MGQKKKDLPVYRLVVNEFNEESGVDFVSLVEHPAIEQDFFAFSKDSPNKSFQFKADPSRRIVTGPMMLTDTPIYRFDQESGQEFYVVFDKATVEKIAHKFFKKSKSNNVNIDHSEKVDGVYLFESIITDNQRGTVAPKGFPKVPEGSWFGSYKIENEDVWQSVLNKTFKGFSIEGYFDTLEMKMSRDEVDIAFEDL